MIDSLRSFWTLVNEEPLNPRRLDTDSRSLRKMIVRFFLRPYWPHLVLIIALGSMVGAGAVTRYFWAWSVRFVADEVVQVQRLAEDTPAAAKLDPSLPGENRRFVIDEPHERTSWTQRHNAATGRSVSEKLHLLGGLALAILAVLVLESVGIWLHRSRMIYVGQKVQFQMRHRLYEKLHTLPMAYHDQHAIGALMTNLFSDVSEVREDTLKLLINIPRNVLTMIVGLVILLSIDPPLAALVIVALPCYAVCYRWFRHRLKVVNENRRERQGKLNGHIADRISNFYVVKSFGRETFEALSFLRRSRKIVRNMLAAAMLGSLFGVVCGIMSGVCMVAVLWIGALRVQSGQMSLGTLLLFYTSAGFLFVPVKGLTGLANQYHRLCAVSQKVMRVLDEPISLTDPLEPAAALTSAPEVRFDNVSMRYDENRPPALSDVSFTLPAGRTLCVMGPSGSGKTTLAKLACRIYDPADGAVYLSDTDIRKFKMIDLRSTIGFVTQEPVIFDGTIAGNIRYGSEQSPEREIVTAARNAQIHDFIVRLPDQYDTMTCERGLTLSGGQKQRVNLARTLLYDPKILILDDCTSALDAETEAKLVKSFDTALKGRTALLVSHRISIALKCDYVMMLDDGRIAEFGQPQELLDNDGPFTELHEEQTRRSSTLQLQPT